jgi:hypothetical protein
LAIVAAVVTLGGGGLALSLVSARVCMDESLYTTPGHFAYYACVSSTMRHVPRVLPASEPTFYASAGDGPKPAQDEMTYLSRAIPSDVVAATARYLSSAGFGSIGTSGTSSTAVLRGAASSVTIAAQPAEAGTCKVKVTQTFY